MKKILFLLLFPVCFYSFAQKTEACKCDLLKQSQDSIQNSYSKNEFTPVSVEEALKPRFSFVSVKFLDKYAQSEDILDSLEMKVNNASKNKVPDILLGSYKIRDSIRKIEFSKKIGDIPKPMIIKTGKIKKVKGILYVAKNKYYLRMSKDDGKTWKNYFTGLKARDNYFFKSNSKYPLWKDNNHIQVEADVVRLTRLPSFPSHPEPEFETIKNNALVTLNIKEIMKDSDQDGFNDLEELDLFTNPKSKDTDNDGIIDSEDHNPKYKSVNNDFTKLVQAILYGDYTFLEDSDPYLNEFIINLNTFEEDIKKQREDMKSYSSKDPKNFLDSFDFKVLVSDDENFRRIKPFEEKIIFLTSKEFQEHIQSASLNSYALHYSKIFKCDEKENTYILVFNGITRGESYLITKIPEGWRVKIIDSWIS